MSDKRAKSSVSGLLWDGLISTYGHASGGLGMIAGIIAWRFAPTISVPLWLVAFISITVVLPLIIGLVQGLRIATRAMTGTVRVHDVQLPCSPYETSKCVCLIEPEHASVTLNIGAMTTFYRTVDGYEKLVGVGTVRHLQEDGRYQVTVDSVVRGVDDYIKSLCDQKKDAVGQLRVVIGFSASHIEHVERLLPESKAHALSQHTADVSSEADEAPMPAKHRKAG
jgi:hypothetical protein